MSSDIALFLVGAAASFFTHIYYKKSLKQQERAAASQIAILEDSLAAQNKTGAALLQQQRIEECVAEYHRVGTPVRIIDTYSDLTNEKKAQILDTVMLRVKGRKAKNNKYLEA